MKTTTLQPKNGVYTTFEEYNTSTFILDDNDVVVNPKNDNKRGFSQNSRLFFRVITAIVSIFVILATIVFSPAPAQAEEECAWNNVAACVTEPIREGISAFTDGVKGLFCSVGSSNGSAPESAWGGTSGMFSMGMGALAVDASKKLKGISLDTSKPYTAYEKYGTAGTNWTFSRESVEGIQEYACFPVDKIIMNTAANSVFSVTEIIAGFSSWVYSFAIGHESFDRLINSVDNVLGNGSDGGLIDSLYLNYLTPLILLGSLWLFWYAFVKRAISMATTGIAWMIISSIVSMGILYNASGIINFGNGIVQGIVSETTGAIGGVSANNKNNMPNDVDDLCALPGSGNILSGKNSDKVQRVVSCRIWEAFVYYPWATGQYGIPPTHGNIQGKDINTTIKLGPGNNKKMDMRAAQLDAQTLDYTINFVKPADAPKKKAENYKKIEKHMTTSEDAQAYVHSWVGNESMNRLSVSVFSVIASIGGTIVIMSISISMIVYQLGTIFLMLVAPLFLLLGIHPGFGRGIALKWAELLVESILKRIVLSIFLSVLIAIFMFLVSNTGNVGFAETIFLLVALSIAGMMYKGKFIELVSALNFGGTQTGMEGGKDKLKSRLLGTAGAAAGVVGSLGAASAAKDTATKLATAQGAGKKTTALKGHMAATRASTRGAVGGFGKGQGSTGLAGSLSKGAMGGRFNAMGADARDSRKLQEVDAQKASAEREAEKEAQKQENIIRAQEKSEQDKINAQKIAEREAAEQAQKIADREAAEQERARRAMRDQEMYRVATTIGGLLMTGMGVNPEQAPQARAHGSNAPKAPEGLGGNSGEAETKEQAPVRAQTAPKPESKSQSAKPQPPVTAKAPTPAAERPTVIEGTVVQPETRTPDKGSSTPEHRASVNTSDKRPADSIRNAPNGPDKPQKDAKPQSEQVPVRKAQSKPAQNSKPATPEKPVVKRQESNPNPIRSNGKGIPKAQNRSQPLPGTRGQKPKE